MKKSIEIFEKDLKELEIEEIEKEIKELENKIDEISEKLTIKISGSKRYFLCTEYVRTQNRIFTMYKKIEELKKEEVKENDKYINAQQSK